MPETSSLFAVSTLDRALVADISSLASGISASAVSASAAGAALSTLTVAVSPVDAVIFRTPLERATNYINGKYSALGGASGFLGSTTTAVTICPDGTGYFRHFQNGSIYYHPATGAHEVHGAIRAKWASLGWERGFLGYPITDETQGRDPAGKGRFNHFQGGSIYWYPGSPGFASTTIGATTLASTATRISSGATATITSTAVRANLSAVQPAVGLSTAALTASASMATLNLPAAAAILPVADLTYEVHGAIREKYLQLGAEGSFLGYPTTDETGTPDGVSRFNHFQAGSIYWTPSTWAHEVHGLIRGFWASNGWERNPGLGYPISDELIPDRRIGHVRPETTRKPIASLPVDVVKLPAAAAGAGFPNTIVNVPSTLRAASLSASAAPSLLAGLSPQTAPQITTATLATNATNLRDRISIDPGIIGIIGGAESTPAPQKSLNRFSDFENGVLFWRRGAPVAEQLTPWLQAADGTSMHLTAQDVVGAASSPINSAIARIAGIRLAGVSFIGVTGYSYDGASVHNRRHRLAVTLMGSQHIGGFFPIDIPIAATIEIVVEITFEARHRTVTGYLVDWTPGGAVDSIDLDPPLRRQLHAVLDPALWVGFNLIQVEDTNAGGPLAVLSAKTMPNGDVYMFVEPA